MASIDDIDLVPTDAMVEEAERGLAWRAEFNRGGTAVGVARARDISNRVRLSADTVQRMASFFARHEVDKQGQGFEAGEEGYPSAGRIAWALWGGDPGQSWANARLSEIAALEADRSKRMIDLEAYPLNDRQLAQYENTESVVEVFGQYTQDHSADGCNYEISPANQEHGLVCGSCVFFMDGKCEVVSGEIAADGLCKLFVIPDSLQPVLMMRLTLNQRLRLNLLLRLSLHLYLRSTVTSVASMVSMCLSVRCVSLKSLRCVQHMMVVRSSRVTPRCMTTPTRLVMLTVAGSWKQS